MSEILVINPNSTELVSQAIDQALAPLRMAGGPAITCVTLAEGPPGIETQAHVEQVVPPLCRLVSQRDDAAAFVRIQVFFPVMTILSRFLGMQ